MLHVSGDLLILSGCGNVCSTLFSDYVIHSAVGSHILVFVMTQQDIFRNSGQLQGKVLQALRAVRDHSQCSILVVNITICISNTIQHAFMVGFHVEMFTSEDCY